MPFILARRSEIQNGSIQITDLFPNASQRNLVNDPAGQGPFYVRVPNIGATGKTRPFIKTNANNSLEFLQSCNGLVAYLLANVEANPAANVNGAGTGPALTVPQAEAAASLILGRVQGGLTLQVADINTILSGADVVNAPTDLDGASVANSNSTGSVADILAILAGEDYIVSGGVSLQDANGVKAIGVGFGTLGSTMRTLVPNDSSWKISFSEGVLSGLTGAQDATKAFAGVKSATPLLTVYNDDGTIYAG
mgnify:CR=1 FL=1|tara:strand:- start:1272 stop:2024 length:753 start_codon:yes stop_codon:yes gene_type:complete